MKTSEPKQVEAMGFFYFTGAFPARLGDQRIEISAEEWVQLGELCELAEG